MSTKNKTVSIQSMRHTLGSWRHIQTESEGMEKVFHANGNQKKTGVAVLISDKMHFKIKVHLK